MSEEVKTKRLEYTWWDQVPEHLKTKTQLGQMGLVPTGDYRALISYGRGRKFRCYSLYDVSETRSKNEATPAQLEALEKGRAKQEVKRRTCVMCKQVLPSTGYLDRYNVCVGCHLKDEEDRDNQAADEAIGWARSLLARSDWLILDFETTSLGGYGVDLAILHPDGTCLFNSRLNPLVPIDPGAQAVHGISDDDVAGKPTFAQLHDQVRDILRGHTIVAYNSPFDSGILDNEARRLGEAAAWVNELKWEDAMTPYSEYVGEWSKYHGDYKWQQLGGSHSAEGDCRACLSVIQGMAATRLTREKEET